jgi:hypothetical protein
MIFAPSEPLSPDAKQNWRMTGEQEKNSGTAGKIRARFQKET